MNHIDLNSLPLSELIRIKEELPKAIDKVKTLEKKILRRKMEALAAKSGFKLDEIFSAGAKIKKRVVKPKYRNPENPEQIWTGRGRKPKWVENHLNKGKNLKLLLIET